MKHTTWDLKMKHLPSWMKSFCWVQLLRLCARIRYFFYFLNLVRSDSPIYIAFWSQRRWFGGEHNDPLKFSNSQSLWTGNAGKSFDRGTGGGIATIEAKMLLNGKKRRLQRNCSKNSENWQEESENFVCPALPAFLLQVELLGKQTCFPILPLMLSWKLQVMTLTNWWQSNLDQVIKWELCKLGPLHVN